MLTVLSSHTKELLEKQDLLNAISTVYPLRKRSSSFTQIQNALHPNGESTHSFYHIGDPTHTTGYQVT